MSKGSVKLKWDLRPFLLLREWVVQLQLLYFFTLGEEIARTGSKQADCSKEKLMEHHSQDITRLYIYMHAYPWQPCGD